MNALVKKLFIDEKGKDIEKIVQNDGKTVSGVDDAFGGRISISLIGNDYESEQLMLLLETNPALLLDKIRLLQAAESISKEVVRISPDFTSSMKVQGYTENKLAAEQIKKQVNAKQIDRFEDGGIMSEMLFTGMLRSTIDVGGGKSANLQIAVHQERNSDQIALTIGVPIITGDYSAVARDELK
nr:YwmB family TATA-box binding protein [Paenibacillus castaneae]